MMRDVKADDSARSNVCVSAVVTLSSSSEDHSKGRISVNKRVTTRDLANVKKSKFENSTWLRKNLRKVRGRSVQVESAV